MKNLKVIPDRLPELWVPEHRRRMVGRQDWPSLVLENLTMNLVHGLGLPKDVLGRNPAQGQDKLGIQELDLCFQVVRAGKDLFRQGVTVPGRAALDQVGDIDVFLPAHPDCRKP